jgi:hypothetical protein
VLNWYGHTLSGWYVYQLWNVRLGVYVAPISSLNLLQDQELTAFKQQTEPPFKLGTLALFDVVT